MDNINHLLKNSKFTFIRETIMNESVMDRLISECDMIYHLASSVGVERIISQPVDTIERCVMGTHIVLKTAARYRKKILFTSTSEVYGKNGKVPFSEEDDMVLGPTINSRWSYATSKAIDEFLALAYAKESDLPVVIVRLFNTIGPRQTGQYGMVVPRFVNQAINNEDITIYGDGLQSRCFCYVGDVIKALIKLMSTSRAIGQIFNIGSEQEINILDLAKQVKKITNSKSKLVHIPYDQAYESGFEDMRRRIPSIKKVNELISWKSQVKLDEVLLLIQKECLKNKKGK